MRGFRPKDIAFAHRIVLNEFLPFADKPIIGADIESRFVAKEYAERVRKLADYIPFREIRPVICIRFIVPKENTVGIKSVDELFHLILLPGHVEIPPGEKHFRLRIMSGGVFHEKIEHIALHLEVVGAIREAVSLGNADCMEQIGSAVVGNRSFGKLPVGIEPFLVADVPNTVSRTSVTAALLRKKRRIHLFEERFWRTRIPMAHRAEILRSHQSAFKSVIHNLFAQFTAELKRPEKRTVVVSAHRFRNRLGRIRVWANVWKRFLKEIVLPDAKHKKVQTILDAPVDFALPVLKSPMLCLKARKTAMCEIADSAILQTRLFMHIKIGEIY